MKKTLLTAIIALFAIHCNAFDVSFVDWNGTLLQTGDINFGEGAYEPVHPTRNGYIFSGWDKGFAPVYRATTVTAQYQLNSGFEVNDDVSVYWPLTENTNASIQGPVEPYAMSRQGLEDGLWIESAGTYPAYAGIETGHNKILLQNGDWEDNATTYDPLVYIQFAFKAHANIRLDEFIAFVGARDIDCMRFTAMYSTKADFSDAVKLAETDALIHDQMEDVGWGLSNVVGAGQTFYVRIYPWLDNVGSIFTSRLWYILISEVKITGTITNETPASDPTALDNTEAAKTAVKFFQNGQLMIEKNGVIYNAQGAIVK